jgi:chromate transport protein ChrA
MDEDDFEPDFELSSLLDFDFLRAIILLAILIFGWRYYKKHKVAKQSNVDAVLGEEVVSVNYVVKIFEYLLILSGVMGIFTISSTWTEISNNFPEISDKQGWGNYTIIVWFSVIFNFLGSVFLSIRLKSKLEKKTIDLLLSFFYFGFALGFLNIFILMNSGFTIYLGFMPRAETEMYIKHVFKLIYLIPLVLYFKRSKRIKETYI